MNTERLSALFTKPAGTVFRLTSSVSATVGEVVEITLHPSGTQFDGPAVIVSAHLSNGTPFAKAVSISDPTCRVVLVRLS